MRKSWLFGWLFIVLSILNCQNTIYGKSEIADVYFGFADKTGGRVVTAEDGDLKISEPQKITKVIGPNGKVVSIEPLKYQAESPQSNGRQNYFNFDYCGGYYSRIIEGKVANGAFCLLVSEDFLKQWQIVNFKSAGENPVKCTPSTISVFEKAKKVRVSDSRELARYGTSQICLFIYKEGSSQEFIGNLVLMTNNVVVSEDNPRNQIPSESVGEVAGGFEDCRSGGFRFSRYCKVLNIFNNSKEPMFLLEDGSEESTYLNLIKVKNKSFQCVKAVSWYTCPI